MHFFLWASVTTTQQPLDRFSISYVAAVKIAIMLLTSLATMAKRNSLDCEEEMFVFIGCSLHMLLHL